MTRWDLFREMESLSREMDQVFRGLGLGLEPALATGYGGRSYPRLNLREDAEHFHVEALLPGIDAKDLELTVLKNTLTLAGERHHADPGDKLTWHRRERGVGRFMRTLELPAAVEVDKVKADYRDGVLVVTLPKAEAARPKRIEVQAK